MTPRAARLDPDAGAVIVDTLTVTDPGVVREARRWTTGKRGPLADTVALAAAARSGGAEIATAEERIADAVAQMEKLDAIKKLAGGIQKSGAKIETECTALATAIQRLLDEALSALGGARTATAPAVGVA